MNRSTPHRAHMRESVHIASTHRPFDPRIFQKECRSLARAGYRVTYIVPHDRDEVVDDVRIKAVPRPSSGKERLKRTLTLLYRAALRESTEAVFHFHDVELIFHMLRLSSSGRKVVYDAHELTRLQMQTQEWIPRLLRPVIARTLSTAEQFGDRRFNGIIGAWPAILDQFDNPNCILVRNFPVTSRYRSDTTTPYSERPHRVIYMGGLTESRGFMQMLEAMHLLSDISLAELRLAGTFYPSALREESPGIAGFDRTAYLGWLQHDELVRELDQARVGLSVILPVGQYRIHYPTKVFQYMAAGIPVVASDFPFLRETIDGHRCGLLVDPSDPRAIADAIRYLLEHPLEAEEMGRRGLRAARDSFDWSSEELSLLSLYAEMFSLETDE